MSTKLIINPKERSRKMGTRHLIMVYHNNKYKVAQYGQWDGYPQVAGVGTLEFCKENLSSPSKRDAFLAKLEKVETISSIVANKVIPQSDWGKPEFSRQTSYQILDLINKEAVKMLVSEVRFAKDGLFCEWGYVVDLDKNQFEVYEGFKKPRLAETERFFFLQDPWEEYSPIKHIQSFELDNLPSKEAFLAFFYK